MSSSSVGRVYSGVIEATVNTSSQDFIDAGLSLDILDSLRLLWQQKLSATGVGSFLWQRNSPPPSPLVPTSSSSSFGTATTKITQEDREKAFHNPALAAIRASQQLQELAASGDLSGLDDHVQSSINGLREMAAEQDRKFKDHQNSLFTSENGKEDRGWNGLGNGSSGSSIVLGGNGSGLKRRISEVSDTENQPTLTRPPPPLIGPLYDVEQTPQITDMGPYAQRNSHQNGVSSQEEQKRRPDPNDDTIGSDLDDSDDEGEIDSENEDEDMPLMLCSYEKVHRTKNKWRANLSHGVVCINGREWVFEKGNGEYEW